MKKEERLQDKKNVVWNMIGATLNAFNSLLFAIIVTRVNGMNDAGIFTYSFATACVLYVIAIYLGRVFQVTDISKKYSDTDYLYNRIFTCTIMILVSVGFCIIKGYDFYKSSIFVILCLFKLIEAFSECVYAMIQKKECLDQVGKSMAMKALLGVLTFLICDLITKNLIISCFCLCVVNIVILLFYDIRIAQKLGIEKTKYKHEKNFALLKIGFFTFILTFLSQYIINAPRYAIDDLLTNDLQTIFGIIVMPATFMGLLGQFIIQPILTKLSKGIEEQQYQKLKKLIFKILGLIGVLGILVFILVYFIGIPVLQLIYGVELSSYFTSLMIIIAGSILYSIEIMISAILIAMRRTFGQTILYLIVSILSTMFSYYLVGKNQILGASIAYFSTMFLMAILFIIYLITTMRKYKKDWEREKKMEIAL